MVIKALIVAAVACLALAPASALTLSNSNGGDGYLDTPEGGADFTLRGADNSVVGNYTLYTTRAAVTQNFYNFYIYSTNDTGGAENDPAGYVVNGVYYQLSPASSVADYTITGKFNFSVVAGDSYGFFVDSTDGCCGRASLSVGSLVPEPATWTLLLVGFGMVAVAARRRRAELIE